MRRQRMFERVLAGIVLAGGLLGIVSLQARGQRPPTVPRRKAGRLPALSRQRPTRTLRSRPKARRSHSVIAWPRKLAAPPADVQAALKKVFVTDLVVLQWQGEQEPVVTSIHAIHSKTRAGVVAGTVVAVEPAGNMPSFDVKPSGRGFTERYVPRWDVAAKGWDKSLVRTIAGLNVGDKVKVAWSYDERKRAVQIQVVSRAKPKQMEKEEKSAPTP